MFRSVAFVLGLLALNAFFRLIAIAQPRGDAASAPPASCSRCCSRARRSCCVGPLRARTRASRRPPRCWPSSTRWSRSRSCSSGRSARTACSSPGCSRGGRALARSASARWGSPLLALAASCAPSSCSPGCPAAGCSGSLVGAALAPLLLRASESAPPAAVHRRSFQVGVVRRAVRRVRRRPRRLVGPALARVAGRFRRRRRAARRRLLAAAALDPRHRAACRWSSSRFGVATRRGVPARPRRRARRPLARDASLLRARRPALGRARRLGRGRARAPRSCCAASSRADRAASAAASRPSRCSRTRRGAASASWPGRWRPSRRPLARLAATPGLEPGGGRYGGGGAAIATSELVAARSDAGTIVGNPNRRFRGQAARGGPREARLRDEEATMAKKTIAVVGATGAQGGGLVRAILADADGGFAARALTRDPNGAKAKALAAAGAEVVAANLDDAASLRERLRRRLRRVLHHELLGALFAGEGAGAGAAPWRRRRRTPGVRHVDLVDARGHAPLRPARRPAHAHAAGQVQGAALRREGRGRPLLLRPRRADDVPATPPSTGTT